MNSRGVSTKFTYPSFQCLDFHKLLFVFKYISPYPDKYWQVIRVFIHLYQIHPYKLILYLFPQQKKLLIFFLIRVCLFNVLWKKKTEK